MDVHLMVDNPDQYIEPLAKIGVEYVSVHAEACGHLDRTLTEIRRHGHEGGRGPEPGHAAWSPSSMSWSGSISCC